jgi:hypothetical protein
MVTAVKHACLPARMRQRGQMNSRSFNHSIPYTIPIAATAKRQPVAKLTSGMTASRPIIIADLGFESRTPISVQDLSPLG